MKRHRLPMAIIALLLLALAGFGIFTEANNGADSSPRASTRSPLAQPMPDQAPPAPASPEESAREAVVAPAPLSPELHAHDGRLNVNALLHVSDEAFSVLPPLRRDCVVAYLPDPSLAPASLIAQGRLIEGRHLLLPAETAERSLSACPAAGILLPVFGEDPDKLFLTDRLIVRFQEGQAAGEIEEVLKGAGAIAWKSMRGPPNLFSASFPPDQISRIPAIAWNLSQLPAVRYAEPNWLCLLKPSAADPFFPQQWALENTGQSLCDPVPNIVPDSDVDAAAAWEFTRGDPNILVCVLDNGVEWDHPDLAANMAPTNVWRDSVDDDSDPRPASGDYHGTSVAGIISAVQSNGLGVAGVAPGCAIMPVRIARGSGAEWAMETAWAVDGIGWAWQHGASVLNASWGSGLAMTPVRDALSTAMAAGRSGKGCIVVVAAGNGNGGVSTFPADMPDVLTVGASSPADERKSPSSVDGETYWGSDYDGTLDCVAPGVKIHTTDPVGAPGKSSGDYNCRFNGTSAAAPVAAGVAALVLSANPDLTRPEASALLCKSAERVGGYDYGIPKTNGLWNAEMGYGRLNAQRAVAMALGADYELPSIQHTPLPAQPHAGPFTLEATISDSSGIDLSSNAPRLYYRIDAGAWTHVPGTNRAGGNTYSFSIPSAPLDSTVSYYLAAQDASPQHNQVTLPFGGSGISPPGTTPSTNLFSFRVDLSAGAITVNNDGPADYSSIQAALAAANFGDVIKVAGGTYREALRLQSKRNLTLLGGFSEDFETRSPAVCPSVINAGQTSTVVSILGSTAIHLDGFTLANGNGTFAFGAAHWAGGFIVNGGASNLLSRLTVTNCSAYCGGGGVIYATDACTLESSRLARNQASSGGSALYIRECFPKIDYCEFVQNTSMGSAEAVYGYYATGTVRNATIVGNVKAVDYGVAGVHSFNSSLGLLNSIIQDNFRNGGTVPANYSSVSLTTCLTSGGSFFNAAGGDFHLRTASAGINGGQNWGQAQDIDGLPVPWGSAPDLGAHEYKPDLDGDGLNNEDELDAHHTSPHHPDSDADGMPDGWEVAHSLNPLLDDAHLHQDGDGIDNFSEYIAGTAPNDSNSLFKVAACATTAIPYEWTISWQGSTGRSYTVWFMTNLLSWPGFPTRFANVPGIDGPMSYTNNTASQDRGFLNVRVTLTPPE